MKGNWDILTLEGWQDIMFGETDLPNWMEPFRRFVSEIAGAPLEVLNCGDDNPAAKAVRAQIELLRRLHDEGYLTKIGHTANQLN